MWTIFKGSKYTYIVAFTANIIGFLAGASLSWTSPVLYILQNDSVDKIPLERNITNEEASWINSLMSIGGIFGSLLSGLLVQKIGRKYTELALAVPFLISFLMFSFAKTIMLYYIGRFIVGAGIGGVFCALPIYVVEIVEDKNRGFLLATQTTFMTLGFLFTYSVGPYTSIMIFNLLLASICLIYIPIFWYLAPETPYYLLSKKKENEAYSSLQYLRHNSEEALQKELQEMQGHLDESSTSKSTFLDIFKTKAPRKAFFYLGVIMTFQQFSGMSVVASYTQIIFDATGSKLPSDISAIIIGVVQVISASLASPLVDRVGRRSLLLLTVSGVILAHVLLGVYFYLQKHGDVSSIGWLPMVALVLFTVMCNSGLMAIPWALMGELLPLNIRSKASLIITSYYWFLSFLITKYFTSVSEVIGNFGPFWIFAAMSFVFLGFIYAFVFETKGKSLKEIQDILDK